MSQNKIIETSRRSYLERKTLIIDLDWVIISITNPGDRLAKLDHLDNTVHRFSFDDFEEEDSSGKWKLFDKEAANKIIEILNKNSKIIVHCEMAYSRSPAVAMFAKNYLGFKWMNEHWDILPNKLVYQTLVESFNQKS
jgi:predicted protein tyrosine phosphatase